jgi:hypothetical protein
MKILSALLQFLHEEEEANMVKVMIAFLKHFVANLPGHRIEEFVVTEKRR